MVDPFQRSNRLELEASWVLRVVDTEEVLQRGTQTCVLTNREDLERKLRMLQGVADVFPQFQQARPGGIF